MGTRLYFQHFVVDKQGVIFACARDGSQRVYNFIVNTQTDRVHEQVRTSFKEIFGSWAEYIRQRVSQSQGLLPTYKIRHFDFG